MAFAPVAGVFENDKIGSGRVITQQEAYEILADAEKQALVHMTWNVRNGHFFICNCCGCCCGVLRSINEKGIPAGQVVNSYYYAEIDPDLCSSCGTCADERCQVGAIDEGDGAYVVVKDKCIGCGLCLSTCPEEAISFKRKDESEIEAPPSDEANWFDERGRIRGRDFDQFK